MSAINKLKQAATATGAWIYFVLLLSVASLALFMLVGLSLGRDKRVLDLAASLALASILYIVSYSLKGYCQHIINEINEGDTWLKE